MANTYFNIVKQVLSSSASSVTFSGIPQTFNDLIIRVSAHSSFTGATVDSLAVTFNGDSGTNYNTTQITAYSTSLGPSGDRSYNRTYMPDIVMPTDALNANYFNSAEFYIPQYTQTIQKQIRLWNNSDSPNGTSGNYYMTLGAYLYTGTAAITSITFSSANGAFLSPGSSFWLYGINNS